MKWDEHQAALLRRLYLAGEPRAIIADTLGYTEDAIKHRIEGAKFSVDDRKVRRVAYKALRYQRFKDERASPYNYSAHRATEERPTESALQERAARMSVPPRDLTAALCGDPRPGYSMLERRA